MPSPRPSATPTTAVPTILPTSMPSPLPSYAPTSYPTQEPTGPTSAPSEVPSPVPTVCLFPEDCCSLCSDPICLDFNNGVPSMVPSMVPTPNPVATANPPGPTRVLTSAPSSMPSITISPTTTSRQKSNDDDEIDIGGEMQLTGGALAALLIFGLGSMLLSFGAGFFLGKNNNSKALKAENVEIDSSSTPSPLQSDLDTGNADRSSFVKLPVQRVSVEGVNPIRFSQKNKSDAE